MTTLHIKEETEERQFDSQVEVTPQQAEGELVEFEYPGTRGREVYIIEDVDLDDKVTTVRNVTSGKILKVGDGSLPPHYNRMDTPDVGSEHTIAFKEHLNGRGEWVKTTPSLRNKRTAQTYYGIYRGHEHTRVVEKTYTYTPPGVFELDIRYTGEGPKVFFDEDIENLEVVFAQVREDIEETHFSVGKVYVNSELEVIKYNIKREFRAEDYKNCVEALENYQL